MVSNKDSVNSRDNTNQHTSMFLDAGLKFDEIACELNKNRWFKSMIKMVNDNFKCHAFNEVENTALIYVRRRCSIGQKLEVFENLRNLSYWNGADVDDIVRQFVDRLATEVDILKKTIGENFRRGVKGGRRLKLMVLYLYEEALFMLNYVFRQSPDKRKEYDCSYRQKTIER